MITASAIRWMGSDLDVVNNARVSFAKASAYYVSTDQPPYLHEKDVKLIHYLAKHEHWAPFANGNTVTFHVQAPIPIMRQLFKHKVGTVESEVSRRYVDDMPEFYFPSEWREKAENVKQGSGGVHKDSDKIHRKFVAAMQNAADDYVDLIEMGVCPEQARLILPQATITEAIITNSLYGWARVYRLRSDPHSQQEIRDLMQNVNTVMEMLFPVSWPVLTQPKETT